MTENKLVIEQMCGAWGSGLWVGKWEPILQGFVHQAKGFVLYVVGSRDPSTGFKQRSMFVFKFEKEDDGSRSGCNRMSPAEEREQPELRLTAEIEKTDTRRGKDVDP